MLDAYIIEEIRKREREREAERPRLPAPPPPEPCQHPPAADDDTDADRGVVEWSLT